MNLNVTYPLSPSMMTFNSTFRLVDILVMQT